MCVRPNYYNRETRQFISGLSVGYIAPPGFVPISCGHCSECLRKRASDWAFRVMSEFTGVGCVLTLTYNDDNLVLADSSTGTLVRSDLQKFVKRLRKYIQPTKIRYFGCGEYGGERLRPHYHLVVLGYCPDDLHYLKSTPKGTRLYNSPTVSKLWGKGFITVGQVTEESVKYSCKYLQKLTFDTSKSGNAPPFVCMSTRPGFGFHESLKSIDNDIYYRSGRSYVAPRYYVKVCDKYFDTTALKDRRFKRIDVMIECSSRSERREVIERQERSLPRLN